MSIQPATLLDASPVQEQMWLVDQMNPAAAVYNESLAFRLRGPLDVAALEQAWTRLVARHAALRTVLPVSERQLMQAVVAPWPVQLRPVVDFSGEDDESALLVWAQRLVEQPYEATERPPVRVALARRGEQEHILVVGFHHAVMDAGSVPTLFEELGTYYAAAVAGEEVTLPEPAAQYADFVAWHHSLLESGKLAGTASDWAAELATAPQQLEVPTDLPRPPVRSGQGALAVVPFPPGIVPALRNLAASHRVTPFHALLAGFAALVHRHTGASDLVIGIGSDGRPEQFRDAVGPFSCMVPVRLQVPNGAEFRDVMGRVRDATLLASERQFVPFSTLVERVLDHRDPSRTPVVQLVFNAPPLVFRPDTLPGVELTTVHLPRARARFDMLCNLEWSGDDIVATVEYDSALYLPETIRRLCQQFGQLLEHAIDEPGVPLPELPVPVPGADTGTTPAAPAPGVAQRTTADAEGRPHGDVERPMTELERQIAELWQQLLEIPPVSLGDDFFEVGGHSMAASRLVQTLTHELGVEVPLLFVFQDPVLEDFARAIEARYPEVAAALSEMSALDESEIAALASEAANGSGGSTGGSGAVELAAISGLSTSEESFWLVEQFAPGSPVNSLTLAVELTGPLDIEALQWAVDRVVERHEILRTTYELDDQLQPRRRVADQGRCPITVVDQRELPAGERATAVERLARQLAAEGFDVGELPLVRVTLVRLADDQHTLLLSCHHLVMDYWAVTRVLLPEVGSYYEVRTTGAGSPPIEPAVPYREWVRTEQEWRGTPAAANQREYWAGRLAGLEQLRLPTDWPRPAEPTFDGAVIYRRAPHLAEAVPRFAAAHRATSFMVMATGLAAALHRWSGQRDVQLLTPTENRPDLASAATMGPFVNLLMLRFDLTAELTWQALLEQVRDVVTGAYAHQAFPTAEALRAAGQESLIAGGKGSYVILNVFQADTGLRLPGCQVHDGQIVAHPAASTDLEISTLFGAAGLLFDVKYRSRLWRARTVESFTADYEAALTALLADPTATISEHEGAG